MTDMTQRLPLIIFALVMAAMSMAVLPVILIFLLAQRLAIEGVTMSGIKN